MAWLLLTGAIASEITATLSLRVAGEGRRRWYAVVVAGYLLAFTCLSLALRAGLGLAVGYGIWSAVGVALTAVASRVLFKEPLTRTMMGGIALIVVGVLLIEVGSR